MNLPKLNEERLNLFLKTRFSLPEEDRATNGLLILLQHCGTHLIKSFFKKLQIPFDESDKLFICDHVSYGPKSIVDGEIKVPSKLLIAIESKIYKELFTDTEQIQKYYDIICRMQEKSKIFLLISPDYGKPKIIHNIESLPEICSILWISWESIFNWLQEEQRFSDNSSDIESYLISEYLDYLTIINLAPINKSKLFEGTEYKSKLQYVLGNETAEKVLLHIFHFKSVHAMKIARDQNLPVNQVQQQLKRFEKGGLLKKEATGKTISYSFNRNNPFVKEVCDMVEKVYEAIPPKIRQRIFDKEYSLIKLKKN